MIAHMKLGLLALMQGPPVFLKDTQYVVYECFRHEKWSNSIPLPFLTLSVSFDDALDIIFIRWVLGTFFATRSDYWPNSQRCSQKVRVLRSTF